MKIKSALLILAVLVICGCNNRPHPGRSVLITQNGLVLDKKPLEECDFRKILQEDVLKYGFNIPIQIEAAPEVSIGQAIDIITRIGYRRLSFSVEGETNAILIVRRPSEIDGPPVNKIYAIISPGGTFAITNPPAGSTAQGNWIFFRATPETPSLTLYNQMMEWDGSLMWWDNELDSNQLSQAIGTVAPQPEQ